MAKTVEIELYRRTNRDYCHLWCGKTGWVTNDFCWEGFKRANPVISKGLRKGQTRKLKRTQLKRGFKLEIADGN